MFFLCAGLIITALFSFSQTNPDQIKFNDLPSARDRKNGLWKDGNDWVLSDLWGEPYHIVFDINGDGKIANPEYGADTSDHRYAKHNQDYPPPAELEDTILIYSSGKDRDPKTWSDNICSWR